ncbi:proton-conducting transporter membrane subunit [Spirochaeta africana]|uniref:Formate hydrogenlyase subunit 3/multisubunit Na+/H+ antiporter, MnhD subunit n=1 Tax=Spirochaeta africana (strain ATCC 700263 / DSM 8902 / Z-7692) TaxID=889378 RepID=H9ULG7_SPIAZ|nr:proton-conducting transporter membrane subunit [Spirochaeta africana]AFG38360.1 formate hydrogenlyase subunit 3/multisubunit Na+/H+ antiporter, MnhD subunit [Spirochaeta africana DSM 8902]
MPRLLPFHTALPSGIQFSILLLFILLGAINLLNLQLNGKQRLLLPAALHISGGILAVCAADLITLLLAWEVMTVSAFVLIRHGGSNSARQAALRYITAQIACAGLFFIATVLQFQATGSLAITVLTPAAQPFIAGAIIIKTAVMPLHFWLIESYPAADPAVTPLLSGFATKVGVLGAAQMVRIAPFSQPLLAYVGGSVAVVAVLFALRQQQARRLLSYHIISQVGYMTAGIGLAAASGGPHLELALTAGLFHLITHTMYKSLLFLTAAAARRSWGHENLLQMGGLARHRPVLLACGILGAAAIAGVPFTSGYASKELLKTAASGTRPVYHLLSIASIGTALSFLKYCYLMFFAPPAPEAPVPPQLIKEMARRRQERLRLIPALLLAGLTLIVGLFPSVVPGVPRLAYFSPTAITSATGQLLLALLIWLLLKPGLTGRHSFLTRRLAKTARRGQQLSGLIAAGSRLLTKKKAPTDGAAENVAARPARLDTPRTIWLSQHSWPLRHVARVIHAQGPQTQMAVMLAAAIALAIWLQT